MRLSDIGGSRYKILNVLISSTKNSNKSENNPTHPGILRLDFADVTFMDSSAVGLVMGRYRLLQGWQRKLEVTNLSERNYKMMRLAGMQALCTLSQKRNKEDKHE